MGCAPCPLLLDFQSGLTPCYGLCLDGSPKPRALTGFAVGARVCDAGMVTGWMITKSAHCLVWHCPELGIIDRV